MGRDGKDRKRLRKIGFTQQKFRIKIIAKNSSPAWRQMTLQAGLL